MFKLLLGLMIAVYFVGLVLAIGMLFNAVFSFVTLSVVEGLAWFGGAMVTSALVEVLAAVIGGLAALFAPKDPDQRLDGS